MTRVLLADESPHAQRMGAQILGAEGFEVASVSDGETALALLQGFDPDVILADVTLPRRSGYDLCRAVKEHPGFQHTKVILIAGLLKPVDEEEVRRVMSDGFLRKPFEASALLEMVRPLAAAARDARTAPDAGAEIGNPDPERVRAAVTVALDAAMPRIIDELTARVIAALKN
jgi:CheY-like chemotaxis protein